jgi:hypothetical protein
LEEKKVEFLAENQVFSFTNFKNLTGVYKAKATDGKLFKECYYYKNEATEI